MRLHTKDFDYNIDWNKDDDNYDDVLASIRDFRIFDPVEEEVKARELINRSNVLAD